MEFEVKMRPAVSSGQINTELVSYRSVVLIKGVIILQVLLATVQCNGILSRKRPS